MAENDGTGLSTSRPAGAVLPTIIAAFNTYQADFMAITRRGKARFERCDWRGALADAAERLDLCGHVIDDLEREVHSALGARVSDSTSGPQ